MMGFPKVKLNAKKHNLFNVVIIKQSHLPIYSKSQKQTNFHVYSQNLRAQIEHYVIFFTLSCPKTVGERETSFSVLA